MWPPDLRKFPPLFRNVFAALVGRIDETTPIDGMGIRVADAAGGRSINAYGAQAIIDSLALCPLKVYDSSTTEAKKIGVKWGTICGRQPTGFTAGGLPDFFITSVPGSSGYVYAKATANLTTLQWSSAEVVASETVLTNTSSIGYQLIATYASTATGLNVASNCGNVVIDICELALP